MLEAKTLGKTYHLPGKAKPVAAVRGVSLSVAPGRTLGVVGESGSGKSTLARMLALLERPDAGQVLLDGTDTRGLDAAALRRYRRSVQIIFQDPLASLNPVMTVAQALEEPFVIHGRHSGAERRAASLELVSKVGLAPEHLSRLPRQLSGGERQRVSIARAIALKPRYLICDEPVSSLDVLVQAQILNLFLKLQKEDGLGYVFISHDLRIVRHMSDRVLVMKDGEVVEEGDPTVVLENARHPYTRQLVESVKLDGLRDAPAGA